MNPCALEWLLLDALVAAAEVAVVGAGMVVDQPCTMLLLLVVAPRLPKSLLLPLIMLPLILLPLMRSLVEAGDVVKDIV